MCCTFAVCFSFFFFQAEDGIRDWSVTGVQTCALPISRPWRDSARSRGGRTRSPGSAAARSRSRQSLSQELRESRVGDALGLRSEERRVGKECRSRWSAEHEKKNIRSERTESEECANNA